MIEFQLTKPLEGHNNFLEIAMDVPPESVSDGAAIGYNRVSVKKTIIWSHNTYTERNLHRDSTNTSQLIGFSKNY